MKRFLHAIILFSLAIATTAPAADRTMMLLSDDLDSTADNSFDKLPAEVEGAK